MKRRILLTSLLALFFGAALYLTSCEDPIPDCELYHYGDIKVVNQTGLNTRFDIYNDGSGTGIYNGSSNTWYNVDEGSYRMWIYIPNDGWYYYPDTQYLNSCELLTFTWFSYKKKSTGLDLYLEISLNGEIIKTVNNFIKSER